MLFDLKLRSSRIFTIDHHLKFFLFTSLSSVVAHLIITRFELCRINRCQSVVVDEVTLTVVRGDVNSFKLVSEVEDKIDIFVSLLPSI